MQSTQPDSIYLLDADLRTVAMFADDPRVTEWAWLIEELRDRPSLTYNGIVHQSNKGDQNND